VAFFTICAVFGQVVGVSQQRLADGAGLGDGRGGGGRVAAVRVRVAAAGSGQPEGLQVAAHGLGVAFEPEGAQLGRDGLGAGRALVPALVDQVDIRVEPGRTMLGLAEQFLDAGGVREPAHRLDAEVQLP
jgi:hypothetical protein